MFFRRIQHSPTDGCSATSCNFGVLAEKMSALSTTLSSVQLSSVASAVQLLDPSTPGLPKPSQTPEPTQTHVHWSR